MQLMKSTITVSLIFPRISVTKISSNTIFWSLSYSKFETGNWLTSRNKVKDNFLYFQFTTILETMPKVNQLEQVVVGYTSAPETIETRHLPQIALMFNLDLK